MFYFENCKANLSLLILSNVIKLKFVSSLFSPLYRNNTNRHASNFRLGPASPLLHKRRITWPHQKRESWESLTRDVKVTPSPKVGKPRGDVCGDSGPGLLTAETPGANNNWRHHVGAVSGRSPVFQRLYFLCRSRLWRLDSMVCAQVLYTRLPRMIIINNKPWSHMVPLWEARISPACQLSAP